MISNEYYILEKDAKNKMFLHSDAIVADHLDCDEYVGSSLILNLEVDEEIVSEPIAFDYLVKGSYPIFYKRIKEVIEVFDYFPAIQFVKSVITYKDKVFEDYFCMKIFNYISCMDENASDFRKSKVTGAVISFEKLVLLENELKAKSLQQRLIFRLFESKGVYLFHESVVEAVMRVEPTGLRFHPVDKWNSFVNVK